MKKTEVATVIVIAVLLASAIIYAVDTMSKSIAPVPEPTVTNGPNGQINQVKIRVSSQVEWAGIYRETNSTQLLISDPQHWNGTGDRTLTLIRPEGTKPWIIASITQGFWYSRSEQVMMTVSILGMDGTILKSISAGGRSGKILELNINVDNPTSVVTYYSNGTIILH